jgi:YfiH family protein
MPEVRYFNSFRAIPGLVHGIATAGFGSMAYKYAAANGQTPEDVRLARQKFFAAMGVAEEKVVATQVTGGDDFLTVEEKDRGKGLANPNAGLTGDGFFTSSRETFLFLITGDCLALFLYEPVNQVCGLVHTGWRGVDRELPRRAVEYMAREFRSDPAKIIVGLSPALQKSSAIFENFEKFNQKGLDRWQPYIEHLGSKYRVDWLGLAHHQLVEAGVRVENIDNPGIDTRTHPDFFSHRRSVEEKLPEQRFGCLIGLKS